MAVPYKVKKAGWQRSHDAASRLPANDAGFIRRVSARTGAPINNGTGPSIRTRQDASVHARSAPITLPKISILEKTNG